MSGPFEEKVIECSEAPSGRCTVRGPGTLKVKDATVLDGKDQHVVLEDLVIGGPIYGGVGTRGWLSLRGVRTWGCEPGISTLRGGKGVRAKNVDLADCRLWSGKNLYVDGFAGYRDLVAAGTVRAIRVSTEGVVSGRDVFLKESSVPTLQEWSVLEDIDVSAERRLVLRDSVVGGIASGRKPALEGTSCLRSRRVDADGTWGVCAED